MASRLPTMLGIAAGVALAASTLPAQAASTPASVTARPAKVHVSVKLQGLNGAKAVNLAKNGNVLTAQAGTSSPGVLQAYRTKGPKKGKLRTLAKLKAVPSDVAAGPGRSVWVLFGAASGPDEATPPPPGTPSSVLYRWIPTAKGSKLVKVADLAKWAKKHPDPNDTEKNPADSNAYGLAPLADGSVLVTDAAANSLLQVKRTGKIKTVARLPLQPISTAHVPPSDGPLPPTIPAEAVPTSVAVGPDGYWYVGELKGFPFTPGTSRVWRIKPGTHNKMCNAKATGNTCRIYLDGFTSIIDLTFSPTTGKLFVMNLAKGGVGVLEAGGPATPPPPGQLYQVSRNGKHRHQLAKGKIFIPGGVAATARGPLYVTDWQLAPGMGRLLKLS